MNEVEPELVEFSRTSASSTSDAIDAPLANKSPFHAYGGSTFNVHSSHSTPDAYPH